MPNQPAEVGRGVMVHAAPQEGAEALAGAACRRWAPSIELPEETIEAAMAVMSCSPAYVALFAEALADAGARDGLEPALSLELVAGTLEGTAELLRERDPEAIRERGGAAGRRHRGRARRARGRRLHRGDRERRRRVAREVPMTLLAAIDRVDVANYVDALFTVFLILIITRIVLGWIQMFRPIPYNVPLRATIGFVEESVDPYLNVFRRWIPPIGGGGHGHRPEPDDRDHPARHRPEPGRQRDRRVSAQARALRRRRSWGWMLLAALIVVGLDQVTKALVVDSIEMGESNEVLPFLDLVHVENDGVAFGFLGDSSRGVVLAVTLAALALVRRLVRLQPRPAARVARRRAPGRRRDRKPDRPARPRRRRRLHRLPGLAVVQRRRHRDHARRRRRSR